MEKQTKHTIDKSNWLDGPWKYEPDEIIWKDKATGYTCEINRYAKGGHLCGYVYLPSNHPYNGLDLHGVPWADNFINVHGGVSFNKVVSGNRLIGFDCKHCDDFSELTDESGNSPESTYKDIPFVEAECAKLAKQLKTLERDQYCSCYITYLKMRGN